MVQNHTSIIDGFFGNLTFFPSYVARKNVADIPGIGTMMIAMQSVFVQRVGDNSKESKAFAFEAIA